MTASELQDIFQAFGYEDMPKKGLTPLKCTFCGSPLEYSLNNLRCDNKHKFSYIGFTLDYINMIEQYKKDIINGTLDLGNNEDNTVPIILEVCNV